LQSLGTKVDDLARVLVVSFAGQADVLNRAPAARVA
jgi:hypothetical protein